LSQAFNQMVEQLRVKERIRATFGTYVDPRVVEGLISGPSDGTEGQRRVMTVLFCDLGGFSRVSEQLTPQALVRVVNRYFTIMSAPVRENSGIIDKYIGDAIMAYWGAPFNDEKQQAHLAMRAVLDMCARVEELNIALSDELGLRETPMSFDIRIGVATGEVIVGSIGSDQMKNYTVIGDTVNTAARLESIGKTYGVRVVVSDVTALEAADDIEAREIDSVYLAGQQVPHAIYEVMGAKGALPENRQRLKALYADALAAYRAQDWDEASDFLNAALGIAPKDGPSMLLLDRIAAFRAAPPPADWKGVWRFDQK
jgi:adenylate cyclase